MASGDDDLFDFTIGTISNLAANATFPETTFFAQTKAGEKDEFVSGFQTETTAFIVNVTTFIDSTSSETHSNVMLIVGVACGVVGIILGILLTFIFWVYKNRRKPLVFLGSGSRQSAALKKNPREMTFEPLDLSLTPDRRERWQRAATIPAQTSSSLFQIGANESFQMTRSQTLSCRDYDAEEFSFCQRRSDFGSQRREAAFEKTQSAFEQLTHSGGGNQSPCLSKTVYHSEDTLEWENKIFSNSTRGSASSGLGTGIESDVHSFENKNPYFPLSECINETRHFSKEELRRMSDVVADCQSSSTPSEKKDAEERRRSRSSTLSEKQKRRILNVSMSSDYSGDYDLSLSEVLVRSPSNNLSNIDDQDSICLSDLLSAATANNNEANFEKQETSSSSDKDSKKSDCSDNNTELVSTYFDLHFPNMSLTANKDPGSGDEKEMIKPRESETKKSGVLVNSTTGNSDEIILL